MEIEKISSEERGKLLNSLISSGFPFQARITQILREQGNFSFREVLEEQHWKLPFRQDEGFIDIVAADGVLRFVIECKRIREENWIFLIPSFRSNKPNNKLFWSYYPPSTTQNKIIIDGSMTYQNHSGWADFKSINLDIAQSNQCVVKRGNSQDKPILEDIGAVLVNSVEGFAFNESKIFHSFGSHYIYVPVLVTTAKLFVCEYNLNSVDLSSGNMVIDDSKPEIKEVPFVRFRKSMGVCNNYWDEYQDLQSLSNGLERTIFVVRSDALAVFMKMRESLVVPTESWPWTGFENQNH